MGACGTAFAPPAAVAVDGQAGAEFSLHALRDGRWRFPHLREGRRRGCRLRGSWWSSMAIAHAWMEAIVQPCGLSITGLRLGSYRFTMSGALPVHAQLPISTVFSGKWSCAHLCGIRQSFSISVTCVLGVIQQQTRLMLLLVRTYRPLRRELCLRGHEPDLSSRYCTHPKQNTQTPFCISRRPFQTCQLHCFTSSVPPVNHPPPK